MNTTFILIAFSLAVLMGASFAALLAQIRRGWTTRKRLLVAASVLPLITIAAVALGTAFILAEADTANDDMRDLAVAAILRLGGFFAILAFAGSLAGAALAQRGWRR